jgi:hypothetical protein
MPEIELTAVFYVTIPDDVDPDDVTLELSDDGIVSFFANDEEVATFDDVEGYETEGVYMEDDDEEDDEDEDDEDDED